MNLTELNLKILQLLIIKNEVSIKELSYQFRIPIKKIKYEIDKVTADFNINFNNEVIYSDDSIKLKEQITNIEYKNIQFNENERIDLIIFYLLTEQKYISIDHLMELTNSSRNTVLQDLKVVRKNINLLNGKLNYNRSVGYNLKINNEDRDLLFINLSYRISNNIYSTYLLQYLSNSNMNYRNEFNRDVTALEDITRKTFSDINIFVLKFSLFTIKYNIYKSKNEYIEYANTFNNDEYPEIIMLMVRSMSQSSTHQTISDEYSEKILLDFIHQFEIYSGVIIINKDSLLGKLSRHLYPSILRSKYGIDSTVNAQLLEDDKLSPIITFTKRAIKNLEDNFEVQFSDNEIILWSLYFAGSIRSQGNKIEKKIVGIVLCPNGIAVSHAITQRLQNFFPSITFLEAGATSNIYDIEDRVDIIFSTHPIKSKKNIFLISSMPTNKELEYLGERINKKFNIHFKPNYSLNDLLKTIREHTIIKDEVALIRDIKQLLNVNSKFQEEYQPMLKELLTEEFIQTKIAASDWQEAIKFASEPLLTNQIITQNYIDSMISSVNELGPYIVIMPEIAIPHSRPEDGAIEVGLSFANFEQPVIFPNNKPVLAMIVLSAKDGNSHLKALAEMTEILGNEEYVEILKNSNSVNEILTLINKVYENGGF